MGFFFFLARGGFLKRIISSSPRKQRLVLKKTTSHFLKNDRSLFEKRRVTFLKRQVVLLDKRKGKRTVGETEIENEKLICKNTYNQPLSRARVYAHITGVFVFLLSQVSQGICKCLSSRQVGISQTYFNRQKEEVPQIALESSAQIDLCVALLQDFIRLFS